VGMPVLPLTPAADCRRNVSESCATCLQSWLGFLPMNIVMTGVSGRTLLLASSTCHLGTTCLPYTTLNALHTHLLPIATPVV
jgi:hypothetical protein